MFKKEWYKLKLPMTVDVVGKLLGFLSVDTDLVKNVAVVEGNAIMSESEDESDEDIEKQPAKDLPTISAGTMKNFKSALKWFHEFEDLEIGKKGCPWSQEVERQCKTIINGYKRDVGLKKRKGNLLN